MTDVKVPARVHTITEKPSIVILNIGVVAVGLAVLLSLLTRTTASTLDIGPVPIAIALLALGVGIPHGAVDNLTLTRVLTTRERLLGSIAYLAVAGLAAVIIVAAPGPAFVVVLALTVWHFGTGDVEATRELRGLPPMTGAFRIPYTVALGSAPVLLPLTSPAATATLASIEPRLAMLLTPEVIVATRVTILTLVVTCLLGLIHRGDIRGAIELLALTVLGYVATPLVAFAVYFGLWHALRHTARLAEVTTGEVSFRSMARVSRGGVPSLIGFVVVVVITAVLFEPAGDLGPALWIGLAIVWGLTVPHMLLVARFDARMRQRDSTHSSTRSIRTGK